MATMADLVAEARREAFGSLPDQINLAAANASAGATSLTLELDVSGIVTGQIISSGLNVWFVKTVDSGTKTLGVVPGFMGSNSDAVTSGDVVYISPRVTDFHLFKSINTIIRSLSSPSNGLYKRGTWTAAVDTQWQTYAIPAEAQGMVGLLGARVLHPSSSDLWVDLPAKSMVVQREANVIRLMRAIPASSSIEFRYKAPFTEAADLGDDPVDDCGLSETMLDIPPLGAAISLMRTTEARRAQVQTQGDSRRATETQQGGATGAARDLERRFKDRIDEEYMRLVAVEPNRVDR